MLKDEKVREALEPCPFCGGTDGFVERADFSDCYVICNDCGARGPTSCDENDDDAQASESGECEPGERPARRLWNTRTPPAQAEASTLPGEVVEDLTDIQKAAIRSSIFLGGQWVLTTQYEDHPEIQEGLSEDLADCVSGILTTLGEAVRARLLYATSPTTPMVPGDFREWLQFSLSQARYNNDALDLKAAEIISNVLARYDAAAPPTTPAVEVVPKCPFCGEQPIPDATEEGHVEHPDFGNDCALTDSLIRPDQWRRRAALPAVESGERLQLLSGYGHGIPIERASGQDVEIIKRALLDVRLPFMGADLLAKDDGGFERCAERDARAVVAALAAINGETT